MSIFQVMRDDRAGAPTPSAGPRHARPARRRGADAGRSWRPALPRGAIGLTAAISAGDASTTGEMPPPWVGEAIADGRTLAPASCSCSSPDGRADVPYRATVARFDRFP